MNDTPKDAPECPVAGAFPEIEQAPEQAPEQPPTRTLTQGQMALQAMHDAFQTLLVSTAQIIDAELEAGKSRVNP